MLPFFIVLITSYDRTLDFIGYNFGRLNRTARGDGNRADDGEGILCSLCIDKCTFDFSREKFSRRVRVIENEYGEPRIPHRPVDPEIANEILQEFENYYDAELFRGTVGGGSVIPRKVCETKNNVAPLDGKRKPRCNRDR